MIDSAAAWEPGDSGIKPGEDAGRSQYWRYWRARGRRSGADHPDSSGTRGRGINHLVPDGTLDPPGPGRRPQLHPRTGARPGLPAEEDGLPLLACDGLAGGAD